MDEVKKSDLTGRQKKRRKYWQESKGSQRVTRARTMKDEDSKDEDSSPQQAAIPTLTISSHGFKTNIASPAQLSQVNVKKKRKSPLKQKHLKNVTKSAKNADKNVSEKTTTSTTSDSSSSNTQQNIPATNNIPVQSIDGKIDTESSIHTPKKYVLFVGNLPYNVTKEQVEEHFRKTGGVKAVRVPKVKGTDKSKGFAYVEFKNTISHRIALRLHQTTLGGRKINVEFTSSGGKNQNRKIRLKEKNAKLAKFKMPFDT